MGMDLCYYGVKEENIPDILDGNFFEEDFSDSEPQHTLRVFFSKGTLLCIFRWKRIRRRRFSRKK